MASALSRLAARVQRLVEGSRARRSHSVRSAGFAGPRRGARIHLISAHSVERTLGQLLNVLDHLFALLALLIVVDVVLGDEANRGGEAVELLAPLLRVVNEAERLPDAVGRHELLFASREEARLARLVVDTQRRRGLYVRRWRPIEVAVVIDSAYLGVIQARYVFHSFGMSNMTNEKRVQAVLGRRVGIHARSLISQYPQ